MNYQETIDFLYSRLPVFHNIGARAFKPGLTTTFALCESLGNPQLKYPCIHVGGTNGKGSTSHMIAAILQQAGYRVGLYTSPHLKSFTERIRVNGEPIDEDYVVKFTSDNILNIDRFEPSFFELTVAMAFSYFESSNVDVAVIEVGMGGRLDSTNVITPVLTVITNIGLDHTQFLGDTLAKIAVEKAGIIKENVPVVVSEYQYDIADVFINASQSKNSPLTFASQELLVVDSGLIDGYMAVSIYDSSTNALLYEDMRLDLTGSYQLKNVCGVIAACNVLSNGNFEIDKKDIFEALRQVVPITGLKGRWQKLGSNPEVYCDTAHNTPGLKYTIQQFESLPSIRKRFVIGFVGDKDISSMLALFPKDADYYFTQPSNQRALPVADLQQMALKYGLSGQIFENVNKAIGAARYDSSSDDSIYIGGSTFTVADLDEL